MRRSTGRWVRGPRFSRNLGCLPARDEGWLAPCNWQRGLTASLRSIQRSPPNSPCLLLRAACRKSPSSLETCRSSCSSDPSERHKSKGMAGTAHGLGGRWKRRATSECSFPLVGLPLRVRAALSLHD